MTSRAFGIQTQTRQRLPRKKEGRKKKGDSRRSIGSAMSKSAFDVSHPQPLMVIMTAYHVKVIIFPFLEKGQPLVELKEFNF